MIQPMTHDSPDEITVSSTALPIIQYILPLERPQNHYSACFKIFFLLLFRSKYNISVSIIYKSFLLPAWRL